MSDYLPDSEVVLASLCPGCNPERTEGSYVPHPCPQHQPGREGIDDARVQAVAYLSAGEAGGEDNRAWCEWLHRRKTLLRGPG